MSLSQKNLWGISVAAGLAATFVLMTARCGAGEFGLESAGARYGFGANQSSISFRQAEVFADWKLPWGWDLGKEWRLQTLVDSSAGWLGDPESDGAIFQVGPALRLGRGRFPVTITGGVNPTILTTVDYQEKDFGTGFQFTSYLGVSVDLGAHFRFGYRYQHMSNAGLGRSNPGLNLNVFALSYVF